jgi:hypothetical protein
MGLNRPAVIERLEELAKITVTALTLRQLTAFIDGIRAVKPLADIAEDADMAVDEVLKLTAKLGTWLRHSNKSQAVDLEVVAAAKMDQLAMFQDPSKKVAVMPVGFERHRENRSDVANSFAAIVHHDPDETTLMRFLDRQYSNSGGGTLEAHDVFTFWTVARLGFVDRLDKIASNDRGHTSPGYARVLVSAFELLATAVADAERAVAVAVDQTASVDDVLAATVTLRWVDEAGLHQLVKAAKLASGGRRDILTKEQRNFATRIAVSPLWQLRNVNVDQLTIGQVLRIVEAAGLLHDSTRRDDAEIRRRLVALGFERDMDRLLPMANRAVRAGLEEVFWSAMERRKASDPDWSHELYAALSN